MAPDYDRYHNLREKLGINEMDEQARKQMLEKLKKAGGKVDFSLFDKKNSLNNTGIFQRKDNKTNESDIIIDSNKNKKVEYSKNKTIKDSKNYKNYKEYDKYKEREKIPDTLQKYKNINKKLDSEKKIVKKYDEKQLPKYQKTSFKTQQIKNTESLDNVIISGNKTKRDVSLSITDKILFLVNGYFFKILSYKTSKFHQDFLVNFFPHYASTVSKIGYFLRGCINTPVIRRKVRETLGKLSPLHYDIIHQFMNLADEDYLSKFYENSFEDFSAILSDNEFNDFSFYFKKYLFVKDHSGVFEISLLTARNIYLQYYRLNISEQELINDISFLITTAYEKFHILFCRNIGKYYSFNSPLIKDYLNFDESDAIGYYFQKEKKEEEEALAALKNSSEDKKKMIEQDIENKEIAKIPEDVKKGFEFMDEIQNTFNNHKEEIIEQDRILQRLHPDDKIALSYIFYKELNEQYTTFMTLKEVGYKIKYEEHKKVDIKSDLNNVLNKMNLLYQDFESYAEISLKVKIKSEETFYDDSLTSDKENMMKLSVSIRNKLLEILQNFLIITMKVIKDYTDKKFYIIDNPDEKVYVDEKLHGIKKLNGKPIIYIYTRAYYFIKGFIYRLEKTDLSGIKIYIEE